jgi:toxin secretion/phage lysis holin
VYVGRSEGINMNEFSKIFKNWELKAVFSAFVVLFAPYEWPVIMLLALIVIDTICGAFNAAKMGGFTSAGFKRSLAKMLTYAAAILVVRLSEVGISHIIETTAPTHIIISFLIITEAISVLENLSLLGVPLPVGFASIIEGHVKNSVLKILLSGSRSRKEYENKIRNSVNFQIPGFKSKKIKKLLKILSDEWAPAISAIDTQLAGNTTSSGDLIYYEVGGIIKITNSLTAEKWAASHVPAQCVEAVGAFYSAHMKKGLEPLEALCKSQDPPDIREKKILECIIIALYKTVDELQKDEANLLNGKCKSLQQ